MARKIRLPHKGEEVDRLLQEIKASVRKTRTTVVASIEVTYSICDPWLLGSELAVHDHDGNIYVPVCRVSARLDACGLERIP